MRISYSPRRDPRRSLPRPRLSKACCAAAFTCAALGQSPALGQSASSEQVGFAGALICKADPIRVPAALKNAPPGTHNQPAHIQADHIETDGENIVILRGNAEVVQGRRGVYAERIVYHRDTYRVNAGGSAEHDVVLYTAGGDEIHAQSLDMEVDTFVGKGSEVRIRVADDSALQRAFVTPFEAARPAAPAAAASGRADANTYARLRAAARSLEFEGGDFQRLEDVTLSSCVEGDDDVLLSAREIQLDHIAGVGRAKAMTVKFKQLPIFYFPTATFPINDERKSGFLFPAVGYDNQSGAIAEAPYYINIAPQYDATFTPRILSERGAQILGQFRYLGENGRGALRGEFLPSDPEFADQDRYAIAYDHRHRFGDNWHATLDWRRISDAVYLRDFATEVERVSASYVPKKARLDYYGTALRVNARVTAYDSTDPAIPRTDRPFESLPHLGLEMKPRKFGPLEGSLTAQYDNFRHDDDDKVKGARLRLRPQLSLPFRKSYGYLIPSASLQAVRYSLDDNAPGTDNRPSAEIPVYSIDGRLFFDRQLDYRGGAYSQTLEPRLFYLKVPEKRAQREFPDFDTSAGSRSSFAHYFRKNRFFGGDRVGDTEQIAAGITSRIVDRRTGRQRLKLSVGQIFYLKDREIGLTADAQPETEDASGLLGEAVASVSENWSLTGFARWSDARGAPGALRLAADYRRDRRRSASAAYTYNDDFSAQISEQVNVAFQTPLGARWQLQGNGAYSLETDSLQASGLGLSFDGCCWAARVAVQRYLDGEGAHKNRFVFTFELDDLGRIRSGL